MYKNNLVGCAVKVCALHEGVQRVTNELWVPATLEKQGVTLRQL